MKFRHLVSTVLAVGAAVIIVGAQQQNSGVPPVKPGVPASGDAATYRLLLDKYCVTCHNERTKTADLSLQGLDLERVGVDALTWERVVRKLNVRAMPPQGLPRPADSEVEAFLSWLTSELARSARAQNNPGRVTVHRLNRTEYANVIRDLLSLEIDVTELLPPDSSSYGFDNIADVLKFSPLLLERYLSAAMKISAVALGDPAIGAGGQSLTIPLTRSQAEQVDGLPAGTRGGTLVNYNFPLDGEYQLKASLFRVNSGGARGLEGHSDPFEFEILIDGAVVHSAQIGGREAHEQSQQFAGEAQADAEKKMNARVRVAAGPHRVGFTFRQKGAARTQEIFQIFEPSSQDPGDPGGLPQLASVSIQGPFNPTGPGTTPSRRRILTCTPTAATEQACARRIFGEIAHRAYRRPVAAGELDELMRFYADGRAEGNFEGGIQAALARILTSPSFLFRYEQDPANAAPNSVYPISDLALASRLSFFLWSSIPDDELLTLAERGQLRRRGVLERQVDRMLNDPKSIALTTNFVGQWLFLRNLNGRLPDRLEFPDFDERLRDAFIRETELFFDSILRENRSALDLIRADYTFANERLAKHYGLEGVYGPQFRRVSLATTPRRGLLGHGSILTVTSAQTRTSPVLRGKWILTNILNTPPPDPPPNVPAFPTTNAGAYRSVRERLEEHRRNPVCAQCHRTIDPPGFALENFDATGKWRDRDGTGPIDASGALADGTQIDGVAALRDAILQRPYVFVDTMAEKLMVYALGRGLDPVDHPVVRAIVRNAAMEDYRMRSIVAGIVKSTPFQMKRAEARPEATATRAAR